MCGYLSVVGAVCVIVIGLPLYFAGFQQRVAWNRDLVPSTCEVTAHRIDHRQCTYCCSTCYRTVCSTYDDEQTCHQQSYCCATCYRDCWYGFYTKMWETNTTAQSEVVSIGSTIRSEDTLRAILTSEYAIGRRWPCLYHATEIDRVTDKPYETQGWLIAAIIAFALGGLMFFVGCVAVCVTGVREQGGGCAF
jgi:hypothetical protein